MHATGLQIHLWRESRRVSKPPKRQLIYKYRLGGNGTPHLTCENQLNLKSVLGQARSILEPIQICSNGGDAMGYNQLYSDTGTSGSTYYYPFEPINNDIHVYPWYPQYYKHWLSCPECGMSIECGDNYCRHCGHQMTAPKYCPNCGKKIE